jgi:hypothetical protein
MYTFCDRLCGLVSDFLTDNPEVLGYIQGATKFSA